MDTLKEIFLDNFNHIVEMRGLKNADLAKMMECNEGYISNLRHGRSAVGTGIIKKIANVLQVSEGRLVYRPPVNTGFPFTADDWGAFSEIFLLLQDFDREKRNNAIRQILAILKEIK